MTVAGLDGGLRDVAGRSCHVCLAQCEQYCSWCLGALNLERTCMWAHSAFPHSHLRGLDLPKSGRHP